MSISEPLTTLTDYLIAFVAIAFAVLLWQQPQKSVRCWAIAFALVAIGAWAGGTVHGTAYVLPAATRRQIWNLSLVAMGLASSAVLTGTVFSMVRRRWQRWGVLAIGTATLMYGYGVLWWNSFGYAIAAYLIALGIVMITQLGTLLRQPSSSALWILVGIAISLLAAVVLLYDLTFVGISASALYHLVQLPGLYALYRGVRQLKDRVD